jgi:hypothetical protein
MVCAIYKTLDFLKPYGKLHQLPLQAWKQPFAAFAKPARAALIPGVAATHCNQTGGP